MTEVEQIQEESVEATPNPYNSKKDYHGMADEVMPKHGVYGRWIIF